MENSCLRLLGFNDEILHSLRWWKDKKAIAVLIGEGGVPGAVEAQEGLLTQPQRDPRQKSQRSRDAGELAGHQCEVRRGMLCAGPGLSLQTWERKDVSLRTSREFFLTGAWGQEGEEVRGKACRCEHGPVWKHHVKKWVFYPRPVASLEEF